MQNRQLILKDRPKMHRINYNWESLLIYPKYVSGILFRPVNTVVTLMLSTLWTSLSPQDSTSAPSDYSGWSRIMASSRQLLIHSYVVLGNLPILQTYNHMDTTKFKLACLASSTISCWFFSHQDFHSTFQFEACPENHFTEHTSLDSTFWTEIKSNFILQIHVPLQ